MECTRLVHTLVGVSTEVITLALDQSGRQTLGTQAVEVRERRCECRGRQAVACGFGHHVAPGAFGGFDGVLEIRCEQQRHIGLTGFERFGDAVEELRTDDAATTPDARHSGQIDIPIVFLGGGGDLVETLRVGNDLGGVEGLADIFDEGLLLLVIQVQLTVRTGEALLLGLFAQVGFEDRPRANTASAIPVTGTAKDSAVCTVQVPVPFMPA